MAKELGFEDMVTLPKPGMRVPLRMRFSADSAVLYYLYAQSGTTLCLWAYHRDTGRSQLVAEPPQGEGKQTFLEEMRRQRERLGWEGITSYQVQGDWILVPYRGRLWRSYQQGPLVPVPLEKEVANPQLGADGETIWGVIDGNIVRINAQTGQIQWITQSARPHRTLGLAEYVAQEELDRDRGYWLSPDGQVLVYAEVDEEPVKDYPIVHLESREVFTEWHRYPFVGQANAVVRLGVLDLKQSEERSVWIALGSRYLLDVLWDSNQDFYVATLSRNQKHLSWERFKKDGTSLGIVYEESAKHWVNQSPDNWVRHQVLITTSEQKNLRRLVVVSNGVPRIIDPVPDADWTVLSVLGVDFSHHRAYMLTTRDWARERQLVEMDWQTGAYKVLTDRGGFHSLVMAPDCAWWVDQSSDTATAPATSIDAIGGQRHVLYPSQTSLHDLANFVTPEFFETLAADHQTRLNGVVYLPSGTPPQGGWPLVVSVYGGPHAQRVVNAWEQTVDLEAQYLARHGYLVMKLDSRGSANRGADFEKALFRVFGEAALNDQVQGVDEVAKRWPINRQRVGIYGWSYGGYMTLRALLMRPDVFKVGVAGAPVTDFRWYDTAYTERYLEDETSNREGYERTGLIDKAERLEGKLLLIHGMVDENVHFHHSAAMIQAFIEAGRDFDLIVLPASRHMVQGRANAIYRTRRTLEYFIEHL